MSEEQRGTVKAKTYSVPRSAIPHHPDGDGYYVTVVELADYIACLNRITEMSVENYHMKNRIAELEAKCAALERLRTIVADQRALPRRKEWISGQQYSYVLLENVEAMVDEACRAAMLQRSEPVTDNTNQQFESLAKSE